MRDLELAARLGGDAGHVFFDVSEELRFEARLAEAGAVHRHERRTPAAGVAIEISREQVLAHTALAGDQHRGRTRCRAPCHGEQLPHATAGDDKPCLLQRSIEMRWRP